MAPTILLFLNWTWMEIDFSLILIEIKDVLLNKQIECDSKLRNWYSGTI